MSLPNCSSKTDREQQLPDYSAPHGDCIICGGDIAEVNADGGYCLSCGHYSPAGEASEEDTIITITNDIPF